MPSRWLAVVALMTTLTAPISGAQAPLRDGYVSIGEGLTAASATGEIEFGWRMFTIYTFDEACQRSHADHATRLRSASATLALHVGRPFWPARLRIVALDTSRHVLPRVPIAVELDAPAGLFDSRLPEHTAAGEPPIPLGTGPLVPLTEGKAMLRARTICRGSTADVLIAIDSRR